MAHLQALIALGRDTTVRNLNLPANRNAALELQTRLCDLGLLDPSMGGSKTKAFGPLQKADGQLGPQTLVALFEFARLHKIPYFFDGQLNIGLLQTLVGSNMLTASSIQFEPLPTDDAATLLAKRILRHMRDKGYWIARSPNMCNIVYVEGMNAVGTAFRDEANLWNDRRMVIRILANGQPQMLLNFDATTEPGLPERAKPHPLGIARIAFGQYKAWKYGLHKSRQVALRQSSDIRIHRDKNADTFRTGDKIFVGSDFGINQHSTTIRSLRVGDWSAGCLVGREWGEHLDFLAAVKSDVRYALNANYEFVSTILPGDALPR
jgi:hypothetical protein